MAKETEAEVTSCQLLEEAVRATCGCARRTAKSSRQEAGTCGTCVATLQIKHQGVYLGRRLECASAQQKEGTLSAEFKHNKMDLVKFLFIIVICRQF